MEDSENFVNLNYQKNKVTDNNSDLTEQMEQHNTEKHTFDDFTDSKIPQQVVDEQIKDSNLPENSNVKDSSNQMSQRHRLSSSERSNTTAEDHAFISPPKDNCPELIIFCVDASAEMEKMTFRSRAGDKLSPRNQTKKGLSIFLQSKNRIDKRHEYALMLLKEGALWVRDFTNNIRDILHGLDDAIEPEECETCDIGSVFDQVLERIDLPKVEGEVNIIPPQYIIRLVLIYGRSNCPLEFTKRESFNLLNSSPYFFLDVIYIHEPISEENQCQSVFDSICDLDQTGQSYIFSVSRNPTKLFDHMAQLLAHPLQRPLQNGASYRIGSSVPDPENG